MVARRRRQPDEDGSQVVQAVVAIPMLLMFALSSIQLSFVAASEAALSSQIQKAVAVVNAAELGAADKDAALKALISREGSMIDPDSLDVANTTVTYPSRTSLASSVDDGSGASSISKNVQTARIEADVSYRMPTMINAFGFGEMTLARHVSCVQTVEAKVEVR